MYVRAYVAGLGWARQGIAFFGLWPVRIFVLFYSTLAGVNTTQIKSNEHILTEPCHAMSIITSQRPQFLFDWDVILLDMWGAYTAAAAAG